MVPVGLCSAPTPPPGSNSSSPSSVPLAPPFASRTHSSGGHNAALGAQLTKRSVPTSQPTIASRRRAFAAAPYANTPPPLPCSVLLPLISDLGKWMEHSGSPKQSRRHSSLPGNRNIQSHILRPVQKMDARQWMCNLDLVFALKLLMFRRLSFVQHFSIYMHLPNLYDLINYSMIIGYWNKRAYVILSRSIFFLTA